MAVEQHYRQRARDIEFICYSSQHLPSKTGLRNLILLKRISHHEEDEKSLCIH